MCVELYVWNSWGKSWMQILFWFVKTLLRCCLVVLLPLCFPFARVTKTTWIKLVKMKKAKRMDAQCTIERSYKSRMIQVCTGIDDRSDNLCINFELNLHELELSKRSHVIFRPCDIKQNKNQRSMSQTSHASTELGKRLFERICEVLIVNEDITNQA